MVQVRKNATESRVIRLAPGARLSCDREPATAVLWLLAGEQVRLNQHALAILTLCDGSRSRDRVVVDAILGSSGSMRAADVIEFLDAARSRSWLIETVVRNV